jgi:hypothetical protein
MAKLSQHRLQKAVGHAILKAYQRETAMRKIERQMNDAITASKDWRLDNTEVVNKDGVSIVKLYGKTIAEVGATWICLYDGGYRSVTTKSRLNAILNAHGCNFDSVFQKKGEWFFHDSARSVDMPFFNGLTIQ